VVNQQSSLVFVGFVEAGICDPESKLEVAPGAWIGGVSFGECVLLLFSLAPGAFPLSISIRTPRTFDQLDGDTPVVPNLADRVALSCDAQGALVLACPTARMAAELACDPTDVCPGG